MTELLTAAQMRAIEQAAIDSGEVTGLELMERAGRGVVEAVLEEWPEMAMAPQRAVVLCGPGNNGGDGFVVARLLKDRGWAVEVFLYGEVAKLPPDAKVNAERWLEIGEVKSLNLESMQLLANEMDVETGVLVDAIFGTGLSRPIDQELIQCIDFVTRHRPFFFLQVVSIDIPSGMCADSGRILREANSDNPLLRSDLTVSFHTGKTGQYASDALNTIERIRVVDIGLDNISMDDIPQQTELIEGVGWNLSKATKAIGYKYSYGHALILSGPHTKTGAARLAARGAMRIGAGLVTVGSPSDALAEHAAQLNAIMLGEIGDAEALTEALSDTRINALCLGPGLGLDDRAKGLVEAALVFNENRIVPDAEVGVSRPPRGEGRARSGADAPGTVLDADALTILSKEPDLFALLHDKCVLTPHAGEFARLFPDIVEKLNAIPTTGPAYSKVDATREAAKRAGCVVLFKGPDTVIAAPDGRCSINSAHYERGAPWLATAGSGDVLAGFITGLLARGFPPMQAAETAAWLHVECALTFGPGLIAEDIPEQLPAVFKALNL